MSSVGEDECYIGVFVNYIQTCSLADLKCFFIRLANITIFDILTFKIVLKTVGYVFIIIKLCFKSKPI